jgi:hypothetical protein
MNYVVSKIAPDWIIKGFHVHVDGIELALRPGHGGTIVIKPVFSSTPPQVFLTAAGKMRIELNDLFVRQHLHREALRARDYLRSWGTDQATAKSGELNFLIHALKKMGV